MPTGLMTTPPRQLCTSEILKAIADTPEFENQLQESRSPTRALSLAAQVLSGMNEDAPTTTATTITSKETALYGVVGSLSSYVYGLEGIEHIDTVGKRLYRQRQAFKAKKIPFNRAVKSYIEQDPGIQFGDISDTIVDIYGVMNRDRWGDDRDSYEQAAYNFKERIGHVLRGMYQEIATVRVIESLREQGVDVSANSHVSIDDDLNGIDLYTTLDRVTFPVDVKASRETARNAREKSSHPAAIITSGLRPPRSTDTFEIDPAEAARASIHMLNKLYNARTEFLAIKLGKLLDLDKT